MPHTANPESALIATLREERAVVCADLRREASGEMVCWRVQLSNWRMVYRGQLDAESFYRRILEAMK